MQTILHLAEVNELDLEERAIRAKHTANSHHLDRPAE